MKRSLLHLFRRALAQSQQKEHLSPTRDQQSTSSPPADKSPSYLALVLSLIYALCLHGPGLVVAWTRTQWHKARLLWHLLRLSRLLSHRLERPVFSDLWRLLKARSIKPEQTSDSTDSTPRQ